MATDLETDLDRRRARPLSVRQVTVVGIVAFTLFTLMNAPSLKRIVERQPIGWQRSLELALLEPVEGLSGLLHLDQPREWADEELGREFGDASAFDDLLAEGEGQDAPEPDPTALRQPTAADPLRIFIVGDSQAQILGESLIARASSTGVMDATLTFEFSTGLTRPDVFNWPQRIVDIVETEHPDVIVAVFGANDSQGMELDSGVYQPGDPAWDTEYTRRVNAVMTYLRRQGIRVYWVGQPIAREAGYSQRMAHLNEIYAAQAEEHPNTTFLSLYDTFQRAGGGYADYLPGADGELVLMRNDDGIHLTRAGGDRAADVIFDALEADLPEGGAPDRPSTATTTTSPPG
jgi:uncharacterized protein